MDSAPSSSPPPADQDFDALFAQAKPINVSECEDETEPDDLDTEDGDGLAQQVIGRTAGELREIQRLLLNDIRRVGTKPGEKANCAKAYRDIEILRRAIRGKPVLLAQSVRVENTRKVKPIAPTMFADLQPDSSQAA